MPGSFPQIVQSRAETVCEKDKQNLRTAGIIVSSVKGYCKLIPFQRIEYLTTPHPFLQVLTEHPNLCYTATVMYERVI